MKRFLSLVLIAIMCTSFITVSAQSRDLSTPEIYAQQLKELGLFKGVSDTEFDLNRAPSRVEALVMLIRVLGKEAEATSKIWNHPFTDVPSWADNYVGYAYTNGLTNGQSATTFGSGNANAQMYLTFVLRALGYSDTNGKDFTWDAPYSLSREVGILNTKIDTDNFLRADVVLVSHLALLSYMKGTDISLAEKLVNAGVFTAEQFDNTYNIISDTDNLSAEEIYAKCSPAVFYMEVYDEDEDVLGAGSGFFIDNKGTAVTNYHVIESCNSAYIQLSDTEEVFEVLGVYDYNKDEDWAVIRVNCTGNNYLNLGDSSKLSGGAPVYAIGSPLTLQNTISEGIISNPKRVLNGINYIQTNAAISHGSSGGALLNKKGEVIGITSAGFDGGQNLNLALPIYYIENYRRESVTPLSNLEPQGNSGISTNDIQKRKFEACDVLLDFVYDNYNYYDDAIGYVYEVTVDHELSDKDPGYDGFCLAYDPSSGMFTVSVTSVYYNEEEISYYFAIYPDLDDTFTMFWYNLYDGEEYVNDGFGSSEFPCSEFSKDYSYTFDYYDGDYRENDEQLSLVMHANGLVFLDLVFKNCSSSYTVYDLGYTSFE